MSYIGVKGIAERSYRKTRLNSRYTDKFASEFDEPVFQYDEIFIIHEPGKDVSYDVYDGLLDYIKKYDFKHMFPNVVCRKIITTRDTKGDDSDDCSDGITIDELRAQMDDFQMYIKNTFGIDAKVKIY